MSIKQISELNLGKDYLMSDFNMNPASAHHAQHPHAGFPESCCTADPEVCQAKLIAYMHVAGAVFLGAAAAIFTRLLFTSPLSVPMTSVIPAAICICAGLAAVLSLMTAVILKKKLHVLLFMSALNWITLGVLFALLCIPMSASLFAATLGMSILLIECMIYLIFKTKYDPSSIDPICFLGMCPGEYVFPPYSHTELPKQSESIQ